MFLRSLAFLLAVSVSSAAYAASPTSFVGGTTVKKGKTSIEWRFGATDDETSSSDDRVRMREHIDHGFTDWYALRLVVSQDKRQTGGMEHASVRFENRFHLIKKQEYGWDGGIRLLYTHTDGDKTPSAMQVRLMAQVPFADKWEYRHNMVIKHDVGEDAQDGASVELRHQLTYTLDTSIQGVKSLKVGAEMFNDFGRLRNLSGYNDQDHQLGPVAKVSFDNGMFAEVKYRAGISDSGMDHLVGVGVGITF